MPSDTPVTALALPGLTGDAQRGRELGFFDDDQIFKRSRPGRMLAMLSRPLRPPGPAKLDPAALARLAELDPTGASRLLERVLQAFRTSVTRLRPQLEAARRVGDRPAIRGVVHTLKSSSASIGALRLSQLCAQVETAIRLKTDDDLSAPLAALSDALDGALQAIDGLLKERV